MKNALAVIALIAAVLVVTTGVALADRPYQDASVTPETGGGLVTDDGQLDWQAPAGTYSNRIRLRYIPKSLFDVPTLPSNSIWVGHPFSLEIYDYDSGLLIAADNPTTLNFRYNPSDLGGRSESTLRLVRYYDRWVDLPSTVDTVNHVVTALTPYSGDYGLIADTVQPAAPPAAVPAPAPAPAPPAAAPAPAPAPQQPAGPVPAVGAPEPALVAGRVFFDRNGNGAMDSEDFPVGGAGVLITSGDWYSFARTNPEGYYAFRDLGDGVYTVNLVVGTEWEYTTPNEVRGLDVAARGNPIKIADFGMWYRSNR